MIGWLNPGALAALSLAAIPIAIHLLRTSRAQVIQFPSLRFVAQERTAAVRIRPPADPLLLAVRIGIIAAAALAVAQPVFVTASRLRVWNQRTVRVVVIPAGATPAIREAAQAETRGAAISRVVEWSTIGDGIARGAAWLASAPPGRREVVVVGPLTVGTIAGADVERLPADVGVRFVRADTPPAARSADTGRTLGATGVDPAAVRVEVSGERTQASYAPVPGVPDGLRVTAPASAREDVERLLRAVARDGAPAPDPTEPLVVETVGAPAMEPLAWAPGAETPRWILRTVLRLQRDAELERLARATVPPAPAGVTEGVVVARDSSGGPAVQALVAGRSLVLRVRAPAADLLVAAVVQKALVARNGSTAAEDLEVLTAPAKDLESWTRAPADVPADAWRRVDRSDARWFWLAALMLLLLEHVIRRRPTARVVEDRVAAA